jgi:hypothetical protein
MKSLAYIILLAIIFSACRNIDSAEPSPRNTFVKFYEGPYDYAAKSMEKIPGGYIILGTMTSGSAANPLVQTFLIQTDEKGNKIKTSAYLNDINAKSFKPLIKNGVVSRYVVIGDRTTIDSQAPQAANVIISDIIILVLDENLSELKRYPISDKKPISEKHPVKDDYFASAINIDDSGDGVILGTFKKGSINQLSSPEEQLLIGLNDTQDTIWRKFIPLLGNTFVNAKSIHQQNGNIIWASAIADAQGEFVSSYVAVPFLPINSFPINYSQLGETSVQRLIPEDIQPSSSQSFGYGIIGSYSQLVDGSKFNMFFARVDVSGNIIQGSERYFDGVTSLEGDLSDKSASIVIDEGNTLIGTRDGGFALAGTTLSNESKEKNILLIKLDATGNKQWIKTFGGTGDEIPETIREADNGDLVICGTHILGNYSTIFLMRTNKNGELTN